MINSPSINEKQLPVMNEKNEKLFVHASKFAKKIFWLSSIPFDPIIGLFTQSLSDMLGLETLTHGTSLWNYLSIRVEGADPKFGGKEGGASIVTDANTVGTNKSKMQEDSKDFFFVFKDSGMALIGYSRPSKDNERNTLEVTRSISKLSIQQYLLARGLLIPIYARFFAVISGYGSPLPYKKLSPHIIIRIAGAISSLFTPTINFRFIPEDLNLNRYDDKLQNDELQIVSESYFKNYKGKFQEDTSFGGAAWKTRDKIGTEHIGLYGIISQGLKGNLIDRIKKNPAKSLYGTIRLVCLIALISVFLASMFNVHRK